MLHRFPSLLPDAMYISSLKSPSFGTSSSGTLETTSTFNRPQGPKNFAPIGINEPPFGHAILKLFPFKSAS